MSCPPHPLRHAQTNTITISLEYTRNVVRVHECALHTRTRTYTYTGPHARMSSYTHTTSIYTYAGEQYACVPTRTPHANTHIQVHMHGYVPTRTPHACTHTQVRSMRVPLHAHDTHTHIHRCACIGVLLHARHTQCTYTGAHV